jgi:hypothetical protein
MVGQADLENDRFRATGRRQATVALPITTPAAGARNSVVAVDSPSPERVRRASTCPALTRSPSCAATCVPRMTGFFIGLFLGIVIGWTVCSVFAAGRRPMSMRGILDSGRGRRTPGGATALCCACRCGRPLGKARRSVMSQHWAEICCSGRGAGTSARSFTIACARDGHHCYAIAGENRHHAIFGNQGCAIVHPSTAATALVALGAWVELTNAQGAVRQPLLEEFFIGPETDIRRENDLKAGELLTAILLPPVPPTARSIHPPQARRKGVVRLADRRRCRRSRRRRGQTLSAFRAVLGAAAPVPHRAKATEAVLALAG